MAAEACEYPIKIQCAIPLGLALVHNFLRTHDSERFQNEMNISLQAEPDFAPHGDDMPQENVRPPTNED